MLSAPSWPAPRRSAACSPRSRGNSEEPSPKIIRVCEEGLAGPPGEPCRAQKFHLYHVFQDYWQPEAGPRPRRSGPGFRCGASGASAGRVQLSVPSVLPVRGSSGALQSGTSRSARMQATLVLRGLVADLLGRVDGDSAGAHRLRRASPGRAGHRCRRSHGARPARPAGTAGTAGPVSRRCSPGRSPGAPRPGPPGRPAPGPPRGPAGGTRRCGRSPPCRGRRSSARAR